MAIPILVELMEKGGALDLYTQTVYGDDTCRLFAAFIYKQYEEELALLDMGTSWPSMVWSRIRTNAKSLVAQYMGDWEDQESLIDEIVYCVRKFNRSTKEGQDVESR